MQYATRRAFAHFIEVSRHDKAKHDKNEHYLLGNSFNLEHHFWLERSKKTIVKMLVANLGKDTVLSTKSV